MAMKNEEKKNGGKEKFLFVYITLLGPNNNNVNNSI